MAGKKRKFYRGDTYTLDLTVTLDGLALNLTGATIVLTAKRSIADEDAAAAFKVTGSILDAATGLAQVVIPATATNDRAVYGDDGTTLVYDLEMTEQSGRRTTLEVGTIQVLADVSRTTP